MNKGKLIALCIAGALVVGASSVGISYTIYSYTHPHTDVVTKVEKVLEPVTQSSPNSTKSSTTEVSKPVVKVSDVTQSSTTKPVEKKESVSDKTDSAPATKVVEKVDKTQDTPKVTEKIETPKKSNPVDQLDNGVSFPVNEDGFLENYTDSPIFVYKNPNKNTGIVGELEVGDVLQILREGQGWSSIKWADGYGYIESDNITYINPRNIRDSSGLEDYTPLNDVGEASEYSVNGYKRMYKYSSVECSILNGVKFKVVGEIGDYYIISTGIGGQYAFAHKDTVQLISNPN